MPPMQNPSAPSSPAMPGNTAGAPPHPGSSPVVAQGGGAGNNAAAVASIKAVMPLMYKSLTAFPPGSKENKSLLSAIQALNPIFAEAEGKNLVPSAIQQMAQTAQSGGPLAGAPAPGIAPHPGAGGDEPKMAA